MSDEEKEKLRHAIAFISGEEKYKDMTDGDYETLGLGQRFDPEGMFYPNYGNKRDVLRHCGSILFDYLTKKETVSA